MDNLIKEVKERIDFLDKMDQENIELETKVFTVRLPLDFIKQLDDIALVLMTTKTDVVKMILKHGIEQVIDTFEIKVDKEKSLISFNDKKLQALQQEGEK